MQRRPAQTILAAEGQETTSCFVRQSGNEGPPCSGPCDPPALPQVRVRRPRRSDGRSVILRANGVRPGRCHADDPPKATNTILLNPGKGWVLYGSPADQKRRHPCRRHGRLHALSVGRTLSRRKESSAGSRLTRCWPRGRRPASGSRSASCALTATAAYTTPKWSSMPGRNATA